MGLGRLQVQIKDVNGYKASTQVAVDIPDSATLTQIETAVTAWLVLLNNVTSGIIYGAEFHQIIGLGGITPNSGTGSNLLQVLGLSFPLASVPGRSDFIVPALASSLISGGRPVATEGGTVDLLSDYMEAAFTVATTGDSNFCNRQGNDFTATADPFLARRKFGPQLRRKGRAVGV